jgi:hypothetical protein
MFGITTTPGFHVPFIFAAIGAAIAALVDRRRARPAARRVAR